MYKRILVPVDGSEPSNLGLREAVKIAKSAGGTIRVVHVVNEFLPVRGGMSYSPDLVVGMRAHGQKLLSEAQAELKRSGVDGETVLLEGAAINTGDHIVEYAKHWPADLIVIGTHGRRGLVRLVMGSDAEYIVRTTPVPVLLVRGAAESK
jgi:nucleotide-binding universal stress UspA family protein